jgi:hypothetical protein
MARRPAARALVLLFACAALAMAALACGDDGNGGDPPSNDPTLPGTFYPDQGRGHLAGGYTPGQPQRPFCPGVANARNDNAAASGAGDDCYNSNPPSSGEHLGVQRNVDLGNGVTLAQIPANPGVYPPAVEMPRNSIPHILEHAGVFIGYHCAESDAECERVVAGLEGLVNERIDNFDERIVMAPDSDLLVGTIALAAWTRVDSFPVGDYTTERVTDFTSTHSCRFDPEGFCN